MRGGEMTDIRKNKRTECRKRKIWVREGRGKERKEGEVCRRDAQRLGEFMQAVSKRALQR
jgi:hypothetical protein